MGQHEEHVEICRVAKDKTDLKRVDVDVDGC